jgi:hypothetical protein
MSAATSDVPDHLDISPEQDEEFWQSWQTFESASPGDKILWGDKKQPLTVTAANQETDSTIEAEGPNGGTYTVQQSITDGVPTYKNLDHRERIENLRMVEEAPEDGRSTGSNPGGNALGTTMQDSPDGPSWPPTVSAPRSGEILVKGRHNEEDVSFELRFTRGSGGSPWSFTESGSSIEDTDLDSERAERVIADVEGYLDQERDVNAEYADISPAYGTPVNPNHLDRMKGWSSTADAEPVDADTWVGNVTGDILADYRDLDPFSDGMSLRSLIRRIPFLGGGSATTGHTFVDELVNGYGVDVPRGYNEWQLFDYGIVENGELRQLGWINLNTKETILVKAESDDEGGPPNWGLYYIDDPNDVDGDDTIEPDETVMDGDHVQRAQAVMGFVQDYMDAPEDLDISIEDTGNQRFILDTTDKSGLGERALNAAGDLIQQIASGTVQSSREAINWVQNNYRDIGATIVVTVVNTVAFALSNATNVYGRPIIDRDPQSGFISEFGVEVGYTYKGGGSLKQNVGSVGPEDERQDIELEIEQEDLDQEEAERRRQARRAAVQDEDTPEALQEIGTGPPFQFTTRTRNIIGAGAGFTQLWKSSGFKDALKRSKTILYALGVVGVLDILERLGFSRFKVTLPASGNAVQAYKKQVLKNVLSEERYDELVEQGSSVDMTEASANDRAVASMGNSDLGSDFDTEIDDSALPRDPSELPEGKADNTPSPTDYDETLQQELAFMLDQADDVGQAQNAIQQKIREEIESQFLTSDVKTEEIDKGAFGNVHAGVRDVVMPVVQEYWPQFHEYKDQGSNAYTNANNPNITSTQAMYDNVALSLAETDDFSVDQIQDIFVDRSTALPDPQEEQDDDPSPEDVTTSSAPVDDRAAMFTDFHNTDLADEEAEAVQDMTQEVVNERQDPADRETPEGGDGSPYR